MVGHLLAVASKHDGLLHPQRLKSGNGLSTVRLDLVVDDNMAGILTVDGDVDDGANVMAVMPLGANSVHHLCITDADDLIPYPCTDAVTCNLLNISNLTAIGSLIRKGIAQSRTNGVSGEVLNMSCEMEQLMFITSVRMNSLNSKLTMCQRTRLIEDNGIHLRKHIHIIGTLDKDSFARGTAYAPKEGKGHADDESTGTRNDEEHQGTIQPRRKRGER